MRLEGPTALRDAGMAATENASLPHHIAEVDKVIAELNATGMPWSANDLRDSLPIVRRPLVGARVRAAAMRRPIEMVKVGRTPSSLRSTHAKDIIVWQGVACEQEAAS